MCLKVVIGPLHSPTTLMSVYLPTASVMIPEGLVKFTKIALGAYCFMAAATSKMTGMVLKALANPPGPVVSCPMYPYLNAILSSLALAGSNPTRN